MIFELQFKTKIIMLFFHVGELIHNLVHTYIEKHTSA